MGYMKQEKLLRGLNPAQQQAVVYDKGPLLVLAGAGSGKTRVLTHRAAWLVATGKAVPRQLLLLTFTNKAAGEMKSRLIELLEDFLATRTRGAAALNGGLFAGTFHSFGALVLRRDGKKIGIENSFVIFDETDQSTLLKDILKTMDLSEKRFKIGLVQSIIEDAKNNLIDPEIFLTASSDTWQETVGHIYQEYEKRLKKARALDFSDLLFWTVKLFQEKRNVLEKYQERYRHILIDEYQDTNHSQYLLTKLLAKKHQNLTVVGDAAQAIYSWRGADYRNLMSLTSDFRKIKIINLEVNYRSTQNILDAAYGVISKNKRHPILKLTTQNGVGEKVVLYQAPSEIDEAEFVVEKIKDLANFEGVDPTKIAILYRTNAQSRVFEEIFIRLGVPYILVGGVKFYNRAEVKDVLSLLRVFYNAADSVSWQRIEKNFGKRRKKKVESFLKEQKDRKIDTATLLEDILNASGYLEKFDQDDEADARRLENIKELASVAERFPDLGDFLENVALVQQEYSAQEKEKRNRLTEAVRLMTLHASKGLEFDVVFLVGLEEGLLPHSQNLDAEEKLEEERRLCYVGMTRAKKKLFLTFARKRLYFGKTNFNQPSRFLEDIPQDLLLFENGTNPLEDDYDDEDEWDSEEWL
jgi:DNA helicase-2/ATP-dependent DNA helicase PcrA